MPHQDAGGPAGAGDRAGAGTRRWPLWVAVAAQVVLGVFPYLATGLVAPPGGVAAAGVLWVVLTAVLVVVRHRPWLPLAVPPATLAAWFALVTFGDLALGWTA